MTIIYVVKGYIKGHFQQFTRKTRDEAEGIMDNFDTAKMYARVKITGIKGYRYVRIGEKRR